MPAAYHRPAPAPHAQPPPAAAGPQQTLATRAPGEPRVPETIRQQVKPGHGLLEQPKEPKEQAEDRGSGRGASAPGFAALVQRRLDRYLADREGRASVAAWDRTTGARFSYREQPTYLLASVAKMDILLALLLKAQDERRQLTRAERTLAARMIRYSDNLAAHSLYDEIGGKQGLTQRLMRLGIDGVEPGPASWGSTRSGPSQQLAVLDALTSDKGPVNSANRDYATALMSSVTQSQSWGVSIAARPGDHVALKNGWLPARAHGGLWIVNTVGRITGHNHDLLIAVLTDHNPGMAVGIATAERLTHIIMRALTADGRPG
ncbi:serine hydrolase [Streptosporangiaceae bacterium NEAU-GS5]|nr:serine hydrolase [Streptosporangiaceae bacterium NEAU-GS5]